MNNEKAAAEIYNEDWAANYARSAEAAIPGTTGLYRCLAACFADLPSASRVLLIQGYVQLPGGWRCTADLHIGLDQDRTVLINLWRQQARIARLERERVERMAQRFQGEMRPQSEKDLLRLLQPARFSGVLKRFSSLLCGAWYAWVPSRGRSR